MSSITAYGFVICYLKDKTLNNFPLVDPKLRRLSVSLKNLLVYLVVGRHLSHFHPTFLIYLHHAREL